MIHIGEGAGKVKAVGKGEGREHEKIFISHLLQIILMDYYYGGDIPKDEWVWNPEEEEKPSGGSDAILHVVKEQQKVEREEGLSL